MRRTWSETQEAEFRRLYPTTDTRELAAMLGRSYSSVRSQAKNYGITKAKKRRPWTPTEKGLLLVLYPELPTKWIAEILRRPFYQVYQQAAKLGLHKSDAYNDSPFACRLRRGDNVGAPHRFPKGHVPSNKGLRRPGWHRGRMRETQFKKGQRRPDTGQIGDTRLMEGYVLVKVAMVSNVPYTVNWKLLHVLNWERDNGRELPAGHALAFRDGNRQNVDPANLELVSRAELMRRNSYHRYPKEIARLVQLRGALNRQINKRAKA